MSSTANDVSCTIEEYFTSGNTGEDDDNFSLFVINEDTDNEQESRQSWLQNVGLDRCDLSISEHRYRNSSDVEKSNGQHNNCNGHSSDCTDDECMLALDNNCKLICEESSPLLAVKRLNNDNDCVSVKYYPSGVEQLLPENGLKNGHCKTHVLQDKLNILQEKVSPTKIFPQSCIVANGVNALNKDKPITSAASHLAAPSSLKRSNFDGPAASSKGSHSIQGTPNFNGEHFNNFNYQNHSIGQPYLSTELQYVNKNGCNAHFLGNNSEPFGSKHMEYNSKGIPLEVLNIDQTVPQNNFFLNHVCSCNSFFDKNNHGDISLDPPLLPEAVSHPASNSFPNEVQVYCTGGNITCQLDTNTNTSVTVNSNIKTPVKCVESVLGYGVPLPISTRKQRSKSLPSEEETPLQVFVARSKNSPDESMEHINEKIDTSFISCIHKPCLHHNCSIQQPSQKDYIHQCQAQFPASHSLCRNEPDTLTNNTKTINGLLPIHLHGPNSAQNNSSASHTNLVTKPNQTVSPNTPNGYLNRCNQQEGNVNNIYQEEENSRHPREENGLQSGRIHGLQRSYFGADFLDPHESLVPSKTGKVRDSGPTGIDGGHPENQEGSLQRSNTSEYGLLKINPESARLPELSYRDAPNYIYLCIVATILSPLFGLAALLCNHYARRNFGLHRHARANNLYFAAITISTVSIFLTLVGAAVLITHSLVAQSEKKFLTTTFSPESCHDRFFGYNDSLKIFFSIDFNLYCEITKNERIVEALKRFWLEDMQNRERFSHQKTNTESNHNTQNNNNATDRPGLHKDAASLDINSPDINLIENQGSDVVGDSRKDDGDGQEPKLLVKNKSSHNTIISSSDGPLVPPELEYDYQQYLEGKRRTKIGNLNPLLKESVSQGDTPEQAPAFLENTLTTTESVNSNSTAVDKFQSLYDPGASVMHIENSTNGNAL